MNKFWVYVIIINKILLRLHRIDEFASSTFEKNFSTFVFNKGFRSLCKRCLVNEFDTIRAYKSSIHNTGWAFVDDSD